MDSAPRQKKRSIYAGRHCALLGKYLLLGLLNAQLTVNEVQSWPRDMQFNREASSNY